MVVSKKDSLKYELCIGDAKIRKVYKFNNLTNQITADRKYNKEIEYTQKQQKIFTRTQSKLPRDLKITLEPKKRALYYNVISTFPIWQ